MVKRIIFFWLIILFGCNQKSSRVNYSDILKSPGKDWLTYGGDYGSKRYSPLFNINQSNVSNLQLKWTYRVENEDSNLRVTPLVYDGVMYLTNAYEMESLDATTGELKWAWHDEGYPETWMNRGAAILGEEIYFTTKDCILVALNRQTGKSKWRKRFASESPRGHYSCTSAPLALKDRLVVGVSGGQEGAKGFVAALASSDGRELWRFWTIWEQDLGQGGSATWMTGSYDPEVNLLYWATGAPTPDYKTKNHPLDDRYFNSVVALDPDTGKKKWHYQFTRHDLKHWDANEPLVLDDLSWRGQWRKVLMQANRNGYFYVLDRMTGVLLLKKPFAQMISGRCPGLLGATNWMSSSYNPVTELFYVNVLESCDLELGRHFLRAIDPQTGQIRWEYQMGSGNMYAGVMTTAGGLVFTGDDAKHFLAFNDQWGTLLWKYPLDEAAFASPMTYAVAGQQYVAIAAGPRIFVFGLPNN